jgi:hypothetical protein
MSTLRKDLEWMADLKGPRKEPRGDGPILGIIFLLAILGLLVQYGCY